jgi:hypothetical protein
MICFTDFDFFLTVNASSNKLQLFLNELTSVRLEGFPLKQFFLLFIIFFLKV